ncbi:MAG: hypothetical protein IKA05_04110 [Clostridia bacterium]|nr:hypothetical protein [Clostridia bacterium]
MKAYKRKRLLKIFPFERWHFRKKMTEGERVNEKKPLQYDEREDALCTRAPSAAHTVKNSPSFNSLLKNTPFRGIIKRET